MAPVYDKKVVRRRRTVLAVLVGLSLVLLTAYFGESSTGVLHALQRGVQEALAPVEAGVNRGLKPARDLVGWTGDALDAKEENERLEDELTRLRRELAAVQTARRDAEQLRALTGLSERVGFPADADPVTARVIARSPTAWYRSVQIDKGRDEGVAVNQPVITGEGLAGRVASVTGDAASVTLITDESSAVSAQVMPDGAHGIVKTAGVGEPTALLLDFVEKGRSIDEGAVVVTAGSRSSKLESLFPRGIPIGQVTRADRDELEVYQRVHVEPYADLRQMDIVQVLRGAGGGSPALAGRAP